MGEHSHEGTTRPSDFDDATDPVQRELAIRLAQQAAVAELGQSALAGLDVDKVCELAVDRIQSVLAVEYAKVLELSTDRTSLVVKAGVGWHDDVTLGVTTVPNDAGSQAGYTLLTDQPVLVDDFTTEERFTSPQLLVDHDVLSGISVIIPTARGPYGVLGVHTPAPRTFTSHDADFLQSIANVIGSAVQNKLWLDEIESQSSTQERRARNQSALAACAHALLANEGEARLQDAIDALLETTDSTYVFLQRNVVDAEGRPGVATLASASQAPREEIDALTEYWREIPWTRLSTTHATLSRGQMFTGFPADYEGAEGETHAAAPIPVHSELKCPILVNGKWAGLLGCSDTTARRAWTDDDRHLYLTAAAMIGAYWEREAANERLVELVRSKDEFLASVSHELRTPLTGVVGFGEVLQDGDRNLTDEDRQDMLNVMLRQAADMTNIVDDLSVAAKADLGTLYVNNNRIDLLTQVREALESFDPARVEGIAVSGEETWVTGDAARVRQLVRNLVSNAFRYGGDRISIEVRSGPDHGCVTVRDDGDPISAADRQRIFEPFERAHDAPGLTAALGLGLSISRRLADLMGGELTYTHDGSDSIFEVRLQASP